MNSLKSKFDYQWGQQFTPPRSFELSGKTLRMLFEDYEATAEFTDDTRVVWTTNNGREESEYWCLKSTDYVYLICFGFQGDRSVTLIYDSEAGLVTLDETSFDAEKRPYKSAVRFGAVAPGEGMQPDSLHHFTKDLADNRFLWIFCDTYWHVESYTEDECTHICNYPDFNGSGPYQAVKITDTLYYVMNGDAKESICMIYNISNLTSVGRSVVYESSGAPLAQGAVGKFSETIELPEVITIISGNKDLGTVSV